MKTPTAALQTAAVTTLAVASGVTALWLTLGALDGSSDTVSQEPTDIQIEYVDQAGNVVGSPNTSTEDPTVLVVDQFGDPYAADQTEAQTMAEPLPNAEPATPDPVEPQYAEEPEPEYAEEYDEGELEEEDEDRD